MLSQPYEFPKQVMKFLCGRTTTKTVEKPWGFEKIVNLPGENGMQIKFLRVESGCRTSLQYHREKEELIIVVDWDGGYIELQRTDEPYLRLVTEEHDLHILPGDVHRVTGPLGYFEVSTYHPDDVVRLQDDSGRVG